MTTSDFLLCNNCGGDTDGYKRGYKDGGSGGDNSNGSSDDSIVVKSWYVFTFMKISIY